MHSTGQGSLWAALLNFFAPAPPAAVMLSDPAEIKSQYRYWQRRILFWTIVGYAMFYFVRKNLSVAMPGMGKDLGISRVAGCETPMIGVHTTRLTDANAGNPEVRVDSFGAGETPAVVVSV